MKIISHFALFFLNPLVAQLLWNWHISPLGVPKVGYWAALGAVVAIKYYTWVPIIPTDWLDRNNSYDTNLHAVTWAWTLLALLFGWLITFVR